MAGALADKSGLRSPPKASFLIPQAGPCSGYYVPVRIMDAAPGKVCTWDGLTCSRAACCFFSGIRSNFGACAAAASS